jgi:DNA replication protein DnaC
MAASSSRKSEPVCPRCGGAGFLRVDAQVDDPRFGSIVPCSCREQEIAERRLARLVDRSNLRALAGMTFDNFLFSGAPSVASTQAQRFAQDPEGWLVLLGGTGTGKTHLAASIGNYRLAQGRPALFMVVPDLLDHLRASFAPSSDVAYDDLFEAVRDAPLLILDDLGAQTSTQWASEKLFQLFNHRYIYRLATVITSNLSLDEIGGRIASRMSDPALCTCVSTGGVDFRGPDAHQAEAVRPLKRRPRTMESSDLG